MRCQLAKMKCCQNAIAVCSCTEMPLHVFLVPYPPCAQWRSHTTAMPLYLFDVISRYKINHVGKPPPSVFKDAAN